MATIEKVRKHFGNVVLVAESLGTGGSGPGDPRGSWTDVLPYIADVVIDLSNDRRHGYDQRYIQISKSRFQRERRGRHPISIGPGQGLVVAPSSVAFRSEVAWPRFPDEGKPEISFGLPDLDRLLSKGALTRGDTVVLRGPEGSFKTLLGLHFLAAKRGEQKEEDVLERKSLFLTDRGETPLSTYVNAYRLLLPDLEQHVTFAPLQREFVHPGRLLRHIQSHFEYARARGFVYDRVLIANVGRWDVNCPFVREDPGFGNALLDLLRWEGASAVIVCAGKSAEKDSDLQRTVVDRATALLDFERFEFQGAQHVLMRVVRARTVPLSRDWHELTVQGGHLQLDSSLLSVCDHAEGSPPEAETVDTTLHLFQVGEVQEGYHKCIEERLQSVLNTPVHVKGGIDRAALGEAARLGPLSAGSHLRIVQIDEFQLPALKYSSDGRSMLQPFPLDAGERWRDDANVQRAITRSDGGSDGVREAVVAFPYYENIAFLTFNPEHGRDCAPLKDWRSLAILTKKRGKRQGPLLFNFARRPEDYNCVFLEMALSLSQDFPEIIPRDSEASFERLRDWLQGDAFREALEIFHTVCLPGHKVPPDEKLDQGPQPWSGVYARLWFTALRYWMHKEPAKARTIEIAPLPGRVALSGEWYLGVWAHSAVPQIGRKIIDSLTSVDSQWERLRLGIGLPIDARLLSKDPIQFFPGYSGRDDLDVGELVSRARFRSQLFNYHQFAPILLDHLINFLGLPLRPKHIERTVTRLLLAVDEILRPGKAQDSDGGGEFDRIRPP